MERIRREWGANIRAQREARGWTRTELARRLGVSRAAVSYWESGKRAPSDERKLAIAAELGLAVRTLFPLIVAEPAA